MTQLDRSKIIQKLTDLFIPIFVNTVDNLNNYSTSTCMSIASNRFENIFRSRSNDSMTKYGSIMYTEGIIKQKYLTLSNV